MLLECQLQVWSRDLILLIRTAEHGAFLEEGRGNSDARNFKLVRAVKHAAGALRFPKKRDP